MVRHPDAQITCENTCLKKFSSATLSTATTRRRARHTCFRTRRRGNALLEPSMPSTVSITSCFFGGSRLETDPRKDHSSNRRVLTRHQNGTGSPVPMISKSLHCVPYDKGICRCCRVVQKRKIKLVRVLSGIIMAKHGRNGDRPCEPAGRACVRFCRAFTELGKNHERR